MTTEELSSFEAAIIVDARGSACPGPLLEAKKGIGAICVGDVLEIWSGDARTKEDIPKWSKKVGHEFLGHLEAEGYDRITSAEANTDSPTWRRTSHPRI